MRILLTAFTAICIGATNNHSTPNLVHLQIIEVHPDLIEEPTSEEDSIWDNSWDDAWYDGSSIDTTIDSESAFHTTSYSDLMQSIASKKDQINTDSTTDKKKLDAAKTLLLNSLTSEVFPFWYGTAWNFNGITETPGKGEIACGYFVSTTLKQIGFNLNRYRIAQKAASDVINTFCVDSLIYQTRQLDKLIAHVKNQEDGIYVLGLSYHVGFLHKQGNNIYFIHSNFSMPSMVIREHASKSAALHTSDVYIMGNITNNEALLNKWLTNTPIPH